MRQLIRTMSRENPLWGAPRIHGELLKLGIDIGETSVSKYLVRRHKPPSQTWRTFLDNHVKSMVSVDFFRCRRSGSRSYTCSWCWRTTGGAFCIWCHRMSDRRVDRPATARGLPLGDGAALSAA